MLTSSFDLISVLTVALSVCSSCESDATVIVSVSAPSSSATSTRDTVPIVTGTSVWTNSLKPASETLTSYVPGRALVKEYDPVSFETVVSSRPVCLSRMVTVEPGTAAPEVSRTLPTMLPYNVCALADGAVALRNTATRSAVRARFA